MHASADALDPFTSSPMTLPSEDGEPSAMRTTPTSEPPALKAAANDELNDASPHAVGVKVLRIPNRTVLASGRWTGDEAPKPKEGTAFKAIQTEDGTGAAA